MKENLNHYMSGLINLGVPEEDAARAVISLSSELNTCKGMNDLMAKNEFAKNICHTVFDASKPFANKTNEYKKMG